MQKDIAIEPVADEETEAPRRVEPFYPSSDRVQYLFLSVLIAS